MRPSDSRRPLIGLSGRRKTGDKLVDNLPSLADCDIDLYYADYARAVQAAGGLPMHLPLDVAPDDVIDHLDAVLLSGGTDIAPDRYGCAPHPGLLATEVERDDYELDLLTAAMQRELPTLGICRGIQLVNVHAGGTLHQHVPSHAGFDHPVSHHLHEVSMEPDSALGAMYGARRSVNSLHHQTVARVGDELRVTATADDGTVEGVEHETLPIIAVQWHPEMMTSAGDDPLFAWLVGAAKRS